MDEYFKATDGKYKRTVVQVGFPEEGHLGCEKHCHFCAFNLVDYNKEVYPSDEDLDKLFEITEPNGFIQITGAGDPLFNFKKNKGRLLHLVDYIQQHGFKVQLVTKYLEVVKQEFDNSLKDINFFVFSVEVLDEEIKNLVDLLTSSGKTVRLAKIYNFSPSSDSIDHDFILKYINFYIDIAHKENLLISLRCNYNYPNGSSVGFVQERDGVNQNTQHMGCKIYLHGVFITSPLLGGDTIIRCCDTHKKIEQDMGVNLSELINKKDLS